MLTLDIELISPEGIIEKITESVADLGNCEVELVFPSSFPLSRHIRETLSYLLGKNGVDDRWRNRFSLISDELVNNAIEHGSKEGEKNSFYMKFFRDPSTVLNIVVEVTDTGNGLHSQKAEQMVELLAERRKTWLSDTTRKRGRGFQIMEKLTDKIYFRNAQKGGLTVGITKCFDPANLQDAR